MKSESILSYILVLITILLTTFQAKSQDNTHDKITDLESVTVISRPIDENFFIDLILNDSSLYESVRNLKHYSFIAENDILTFDKDKVSAHIFKKIAHCNTSNGYKQKVIESIDSGKVYKWNGNYRLFTVQMFSYLFENINSTDFTHKVIKRGTRNFNKETYKQKLKLLLFNPGRKITGLPIISSKSEIFGPKLKKYYESKISNINYNDTEAYKFDYYVSPKYVSNNSLIIQKISTIIDRNNFKILSRFIHMQYKNIFVSFNINMNIETSNINGDYLATKINYDGIWHILFTKAEKVIFNINHYNYTKQNNTINPEFCN